MICLYRKSFKTMSIAGHQFIDFKPLTDPCLCSAGSTVWSRDLELEKPCRFFFGGEVMSSLDYVTQLGARWAGVWIGRCYVSFGLRFDFHSTCGFFVSGAPRLSLVQVRDREWKLVCVRLGRLHLTASISDIHRTVPTIPDQPPCSPDLASPVEEISLNEGLQNYFKFPFPVPMFFFFLFRLVMFLWLKNPK